jgi:hypothetical protein
MEEKEWSRE